MANKVKRDKHGRFVKQQSWLDRLLSKVCK